MIEKQKKIILLTYENFDKKITEILLDNEIEYLILLYFHNNMTQNLEVLEKVKKYFLKKNSDLYLKNTIILSERDYLANDFQVRAVITPIHLHHFDYMGFIKTYENEKIENLNEFFIKNKNIFQYKLDIFDEKNPWIYFQNDTGMLIINRNTHDKIMQNYHKVKCIIPEIVLVFFDGEEDNKLIKLIKLIGADAHVTLGFVNSLDIPYTKRTDAFIYIESSNYFQIGKNFINQFLELADYPEGIITLRNFMKIPEKNFEADMTYDEEREINKKEEKHYILKEENSGSLKNNFEIVGDTLTFNYGVKVKYILQKY